VRTRHPPTITNHSEVIVTMTSGTQKTNPTRAASAPPKLNTYGAANVTEADIALLAYKRYVARGCEHGHDVDDWVQAELELWGAGSTIGPRR
jgi:hypothetical protein